MTKYYDHKPDYLSLQANMLLFVIGVTAILRHPTSNAGKAFRRRLGYA
jgi:hypothetical protein